VESGKGPVRAGASHTEPPAAVDGAAGVAHGVGVMVEASTASSPLPMAVAACMLVLAASPASGAQLQSAAVPKASSTATCCDVGRPVDVPGIPYGSAEEFEEAASVRSMGVLLRCRCSTGGPPSPVARIDIGGAASAPYAWPCDDRSSTSAPSVASAATDPPFGRPPLGLARPLACWLACWLARRVGDDESTESSAGGLSRPRFAGSTDPGIEDVDR